MRMDPEDLSAIAEAVVLKLKFDPKGLRSVEESNERIGYTELEASKLLGVPVHVLRDARRRGEICAKKIGKRWIYAYQTLVAHLETEA